jgi:RHS repeat-associated protein
LPVEGVGNRCRDAETGVIYLRARYYDPATSQFLSRDPLVALTRAHYSYAAGNPLNQTDPSGLRGGGSWWSRNWKTLVVIAAVVVVASVVAVFVLPAIADRGRSWLTRPPLERARATVRASSPCSETSEMRNSIP